MKPSDRQKMCTQCDGRVPVEAQECPYCSAEFHEPPQEASQELFKSQTLQDSLTSLYAPPYGVKPTYSISSTPQMPAEPTRKASQETFKEVSAKAPEMPIQSQEDQVETKSQFLPILVLFSASNFLILGLIQALFAENGKLSMEWDSSYWFIYCVLSIPLFFFGYKKLAAAEAK